MVGDWTELEKDLLDGGRKHFDFLREKHQFCFAGVGKPLIPERCRMLLALRINVLAKGYSGISLETLKQVIEVFNGNTVGLWADPPLRLGLYHRETWLMA